MLLVKNLLALFWSNHVAQCLPDDKGSADFHLVNQV